MGKLVRVRRRPRYPSVPMGGSLGEVGGPSPEDLMWGIVREACEACHGGILHLLSLELDDDRCGEFIVGEGSRSLCLYLGGRDSGFRVEIGPGASRVCFMGERVWLVGDGRHGLLAREGLRGDVVCVANERATELLSEALCAFAGARGAFHVEADGPMGSGGRPYDVYVRNACLAPYRRTIANVTFHVNCDATKEDWAAHAGVAAGPTGQGMGSSRADAEWLARRLQQSDAAPFLTPYISGGEGGRSPCLHLNGRDGDFWVSLGPHVSKVCRMGECVWFVAESFRGELPCQDRCGGVIYGGAVEGRPRAELLGLICDVARAFAGATGVFHDELVVVGGRAVPPDLDRPGSRSYDVYVRNDHTGPYRRRLSNIGLHVNCDAAADDWGGV